MNTIAEQPATKTPGTRLLDLLHGWKNYVASEQGAYPDTLSGEELADMYQEAGAIAAQGYPDLESEQAAVCKFVVERLLSALNRS